MDESIEAVTAEAVAELREAMTRKIYFDELPRINRSHREFAAT